MPQLPIPERLAGRPTVGGLVVPYITLRTSRGWHLGQVSEKHRLECVRDYRCQICGQRLDADRFVLLVRQSDIQHRYSVEPAMHPECAAYSAQACPMVAGRMRHYRATPRDTTTLTCPDPDCRCAVLAVDDSEEERAARDAEPWFSVWCRGSDYRLAASPDGKLLGLHIPDQPLKQRTVSGPTHN